MPGLVKSNTPSRCLPSSRLIRESVRDGTPSGGGSREAIGGAGRWLPRKLKVPSKVDPSSSSGEPSFRLEGGSPRASRDEVLERSWKLKVPRTVVPWWEPSGETLGLAGLSGVEGR